MDPAALPRLFDELAVPKGGTETTFSTARIPGYANHRLGKSSAGEPALLVGVASDGAGPSGPALRLTHLMVQHETTCRVESRGRMVEGVFSVIRLRGTEPVLVSHFLGVLPVFLAAIGSRPTRRTVNHALSTVVELFRALANAPATTVQGLWAELFLIYQASEPVALVRAWHAVPEERYDFCRGAQRLEVKSASGRKRQHHFSLEQLDPPAGADVVIASVLMERATGGTTLKALLSDVRRLVSSDPEVALALEENVAKSVGRDFETALEAAFDAELAAASVRFYDAGIVPKVLLPLPRGVSGVRFESDLTAARPMALRDLQSMGGLFRSAAPR